jgi:hypothetical protein
VEEVIPKAKRAKGKGRMVEVPASVLRGLKESVARMEKGLETADHRASLVEQEVLVAQRRLADALGRNRRIQSELKLAWEELEEMREAL